jgi:hypothetical protein
MRARRDDCRSISRTGPGLIIETQFHCEPSAKTMLLPGWQGMELAGVGIA